MRGGPFLSSVGAFRGTPVQLVKFLGGPGEDSASLQFS